MINGRLFVQNIADTQIQILLCGHKNDVLRFQMAAGWKNVLLMHVLVSFKRRKMGERQDSSPGGKHVSSVRSRGGAFWLLINCLEQAGRTLVWARTGCNNLQGEDRQD